MAATLHDVARLADVSIKTVSNVINDFPHVRPATREKVQAAIETLGYQPNLSARSLRSGRTGVITLALPELSLSYFAELADSVLAAAAARGLTVLIELTGGDRERELEMLHSPRRKLSDGLLFSPLGLGQDDVDLVAMTYPMVLLGERIFGGPADHVTMQNVEAGRAATEYLLSLGRTRIAVVGAHRGEIIGSAGLRLRGYRDALEAAGIPLDDSIIGYTDLWHRSNGATSMRSLLASGATFDAVFGLNDTLALGAMRVMQEAGIVIPTDVAVVGFDNLDEGAYSLPSLTTIDPGREQIATSAVEILLDRIGHRSDSTLAAREIMADFSIVERESTQLSV
jgi:DNA-binding LacI/PurR family transcriptional regulator